MQIFSQLSDVWYKVSVWYRLIIDNWPLPEFYDMFADTHHIVHPTNEELTRFKEIKNR